MMAECGRRVGTDWLSSDRERINGCEEEALVLRSFLQYLRMSGTGRIEGGTNPDHVLYGRCEDSSPPPRYRSAPPRELG
jgi:hypothetical protein